MPRNVWDFLKILLEYLMIRNILDAYLADKALKLRPSTVRNYRMVIELYADFPDCWPPTRRAVLCFLADVETRSSRITAFSYWAILRAFFNYLERSGALNGCPNPAKEIADLALAPVKPRRHPKGMPEADVWLLLRYLRGLNGLNAARDLALLHFLYRTGARSGEAATLTRQALDLTHRRAYLSADVTKNAEDRTLYFGRRVRDDLRCWLAMLDDYHNDWVFPSLRHGRPRSWPLSPASIYQMFRRRLREVDLPPYRVHDLRHSFTKEAMRAKKSLAAIQKQLGHATPEMVLRYAQLFSSEQESEFADFGDEVKNPLV